MRCNHTHPAVRAATSAALDAVPAAATPSPIFAQALREAVEAGALALAAQPIVRVTDAALGGCEALLRWRHPVHGAVSPAAIIAYAEATGLIRAIGRWVLEQACRQLAAWRNAGRAGHQYDWVSVNVSVLELQDPGFAEAVLRLVADTGLSPADLRIEVIESQPVRPDDRLARRALDRLAAGGIAIGLDDYGACLDLQRPALLAPGLPWGWLKLDGNYAAAADDATLRAIAQLAHERRMEVVCEGVETEVQRRRAAAAGIDLLQGYLFGRPQLCHQD